MADRTLVKYEEKRLPDGPHWRLRVERSSAGAPAGMVVIEYESVDGSIPSTEMSVVLDDLRRLQPALNWAERNNANPALCILPEDIPVLHRLLWEGLLPQVHLSAEERLAGERLLARARSALDERAMRERTSPR